MKETPNLQLNVTSNGGEVIVRQGEALPAKPNKSIVISGTLGAPFQFLQGKRPDAVTSNIQIAKDKGRITLYLQDTDPHTTHVITGELKRDSILDQFALNTEKRWETQEFLRFIKKMRYYFPDKEQHKKIVESLMKWSAQINTVLNESQDNKGNSKFDIERRVSGVPLMNSFTIEVPIFQGYEPKKFDVEIGLDPKALQVDIFLISDDLIELEIGQREALITAELDNFKDFPCSKVVIS